LAISLVFGLASSMVLTLLVIPAIYVVLRDDEETPGTQNKETKTWFKIGRN
jgi:Cu/Ag efflux pump CusA